MTVNGWMDKQMWYIHMMEYYSAINRNEVTNSCYNMDDPWKHAAKWKKQAQKSTYFMILFEMFRIDKSIEIESKLVIARACG